MADIFRAKTLDSHLALVALGIVIHFDSPLAVLALLLLSVDFPPLLSAFFGALAL